MATLFVYGATCGAQDGAPLAKPDAGWARNTVWYAPQVKRWVKSVYEDAQGKIGEALVFFVVE